MNGLVSPQLLAILTGALFIFIVLTIYRNNKYQNQIEISHRIPVDENQMQLNRSLMELEMEDDIDNNETKFNWFERKSRELVRTNSGITMPMYLGLAAGSVVFVFSVVYLITRITALAVVFSLLGLLLPDRWVKSVVDKNVEKFNNMLVKALRRMASVIRSGGSLKQALVDVTKSRSMPTIVRVEFKKVLTDVEYGSPIDSALFKLYERTGSKDVQFLAIAVEIQKNLGGNIAEIYDSISQTINTRNLMQADAKATLAQVNTTSTILSLLPFIMSSIIMLISPGYFNSLFESFSGRMIVLGCVCFIVLGAFIIKKLSKITL